MARKSKIEKMVEAYDKAAASNSHVECPVEVVTFKAPQELRNAIEWATQVTIWPTKVGWHIAIGQKAHKVIQVRGVQDTKWFVMWLREVANWKAAEGNNKRTTKVYNR